MLEVLRKELVGQPILLSKMRDEKVEVVPEGSILVGAGDSYAAALCASYLSSMRCLALDPYELIAAPELARSKTVVFVSVSGRTRSNIAAARRIGHSATETVAVTANRQSPLAKGVNRTLLLPHDYRPRTPGMASFTLSLLACAKLSSSDLDANFADAFSAGKKTSKRLRLSKGGLTFFLGNQALYAVSIYAAAKLFEFFGARAIYQRLEEFSHMELFSLKRGDAINIYEGFDPLRVGSRLEKSLGEAGYTSSLAGSGGLNDLESVFSAVFATQLAVLRWVGEAKIKRPYVSGAEEKLRVSDSMIY